MTEWADPAQWGVMYDDNTVHPRTEWWAKRFVAEAPDSRTLVRRTATLGWEPWVEPEPVDAEDDYHAWQRRNEAPTVYSAPEPLPRRYEGDEG